MNTYRYTFIAACPGNGEQIVYTLELRHTQKVLVEHIKTACVLHKQGHQEDIAADLHARFGGHLTLRAAHHGVDIETVLAAPIQAQEDARDAERLDFVLDESAFIVSTTRDGSIRQCQLCTQDDDENYIVLSGEHRYFNTPREAIDAARAAQGGAAC